MREVGKSHFYILFDFSVNRTKMFCCESKLWCLSWTLYQCLALYWRTWRRLAALAKSIYVIVGVRKRGRRVGDLSLLFSFVCTRYCGIEGNVAHVVKEHYKVNVFECDVRFKIDIWRPYGCLQCIIVFCVGDREMWAELWWGTFYIEASWKTENNIADLTP
jgi:hypothetical protein